METPSQSSSEVAQPFAEAERHELKRLLQSEEGGFDLIFDHCAQQDPEWMRKTLKALKESTR